MEFAPGKIGMQIPIVNLHSILIRIWFLFVLRVAPSKKLGTFVCPILSQNKAGQF